MLRREDHKFYQMWDQWGWEARTSARRPCWHPWGSTKPPAAFWESAAVAGPEQCDVNWFEGTYGVLGQQDGRPEFTASAAPALLGFDFSMLKRCLAITGDSGGGRWITEKTNVDDDELAHACFAANKNILRLLASRLPWNMCQNVHWLMCAIRGQLPGQHTRMVHFATAPKALDVDKLERNAYKIAPGHKYAENDVFYLEVCMLDAVCRNRAHLFSLAPGELFECDFDDEAYVELTNALIAGSGP